MISPAMAGRIRLDKGDTCAPDFRKKAMTDSDVTAIIPITPSVPIWLIQVNMFRIGSSPSPAKIASTITRPDGLHHRTDMRALVGVMGLAERRGQQPLAPGDIGIAGDIVVKGRKRREQAGDQQKARNHRHGGPGVLSRTG